MGVHRSFLRVVRCSTAVIISLAAGHVGPAQTTRDAVRIAPSMLRDLRMWDMQTGRMLRDGDLRVRSRRADTMIKGRAFERADQYYKGVRVFGADVARQIDGGVLISLFGTLYPEVE